MAIQYRKDIDGLRAVAVLLVLFAHAKFSFIVGGFIGVDVFFVISGFLITSIVHREIETDTFSIGNFYMRRIRRILPALLCVLIGSTIASFFILYPSDFYMFTKSAVAGVTGWSNFFFSHVRGGYWGQDVSLMPLGHLWSLAVEEQFYVLWPGVLFLIMKYCPRQHVAKVLYGLFAVLFAVSVYQSGTVSGYYQLSARAFEIFMGALIALHADTLRRITHGIPSIVFSGSGMLLIIASALLLGEAPVFPGWNALWPCLGAGLLILPCHTPNGVTNFLESKYMTWTGRISYSLYLWHWPIYVFIAYKWNMLEEWRWAAIALSFMLAALSYYSIEQPVRKSTASNFRTVMALFVLPVIVFIGMSQVARFTKGLESRFSGYERMVIAESRKPLKKCGRSGETLDPLCVWGKKITQPSEVDLLLIGDSHARSIRGFLEVLNEDAVIAGRDLSASSKPFLPRVNIYSSEDKGISTHESRANGVEEFVLQSSAKYVAIAGRYAEYLYGTNESNKEYSLLRPEEEFSGIDVMKNETVMVESIRNAVVRFLDNGITPVLIKDVPEMGRNVNNEGLRAVLNNSVAVGIEKQSVVERQRAIDTAFDLLAQEYPQVIVIDPKDVLCTEDRCVSVLDDVPLYMDDDHLNKRGSRHAGELYLKRYGNPFRPQQAEGLLSQQDVD
ncbi:MAG: acyltransferase [Desulfovibrionales bacterium]|nr:acyltransferase [Desulfovibrionales bacterium]